MGSKSRDEIASSGYGTHRLEAAIWCVAQTDDFRGPVLIGALELPISLPAKSDGTDPVVHTGPASSRPRCLR